MFWADSWKHPFFHENTIFPILIDDSGEHYNLEKINKKKNKKKKKLILMFYFILFFFFYASVSSWPASGPLGFIH